MLPYRQARQSGVAMAPAEQGWQLWLRPDADNAQLQELLRVHGQPSLLEIWNLRCSTSALASCTRPAMPPPRR